MTRAAGDWPVRLVFSVPPPHSLMAPGQGCGPIRALAAAAMAAAAIAAPAPIMMIGGAG